MKINIVKKIKECVCYIKNENSTVKIKKIYISSENQKKEIVKKYKGMRLLYKKWIFDSEN